MMECAMQMTSSQEVGSTLLGLMTSVADYVWLASEYVQLCGVIVDQHIQLSLLLVVFVS